MTRTIIILTMLLASCGGGGDSGEVAEPQWTAEDEAEIAEVLEVVETLGALYAKNMGPQAMEDAE